MKPSIHLWRRLRAKATTLPDALIATAVVGVMMAGMLTAISTLQKTTNASQHHVNRQLQQTRILDYMSRDLRRALTVALDTTEDGQRLTVTIPDYYDESGKPRNPSIVDDEIRYGAAGSAIEVSYYRREGTFYRSYRGVEKKLATDVTDFQPDFADSGKQTVSITVTFEPRYQLNTRDKSTLRTGTAVSATTLLRNKRHTSP